MNSIDLPLTLNINVLCTCPWEGLKSWLYTFYIFCPWDVGGIAGMAPAGGRCPRAGAFKNNATSSDRGEYILSWALFFRYHILAVFFGAKVTVVYSGAPVRAKRCGVLWEVLDWFEISFVKGLENILSV